MIGSILISVLIVSFIGAALAAMLVVSEHFIANYGECKININDERDLTVQGGKNLLSMLTAEKIFIPSACGGPGHVRPVQAQSPRRRREHPADRGALLEQGRTERPMCGSPARSRSRTICGS